MSEPSPLTKLLNHLKVMRDSPKDKSLNLTLVEHSRLALQDPALRSSHVLELVHLSLDLLSKVIDDLEPLIRLLTQAIGSVTFDDLQASIPVKVVTEGLLSSSPPIHRLSLSYLDKAAESPSGAAFVANDDSLVEALITILFTSESAEIGGIHALKTILSLLSTDNPERETTFSEDESPLRTTGQGLLWRRVFQDKEIYDLFFQFTTTGDPRHKLSRSEITTAQARLLDMILGISKMRWDVTLNHTKTDLNGPVLKSPREGGLLPYASLVMVDRADPVMAVILIDFLTQLLKLKNPSGCSGIASIPAISSPALEFLVTTGLHQSAVDHYLRSELNEDSGLQFLEGAQIQYLCAYADLYPEHFLQSASLTESTIKRLNTNLQMSGARWAHGPSSVQDLNVLAHIPTTALVAISRSEQNPLLLLPTNPANADAMETLGQIFGGPDANDTEPPRNLVANSDSFSLASRAASARLLFYIYHESHPEFWTNIGAAMNVLAMPQAASSAVRLVRRILTAVWAKLETTGEAIPSLPSEESLNRLCGGKVSDTGMAELLNAGDSAIQSLVTPLQTMGGDAEAARLAWRLGREKFDVVALISDLIKKGVGRNEVPEQIWRSTAKRIEERMSLDGGFVAQTNVVDSIVR